MREWRRAPRLLTCGGLCHGTTIARGDPVLAIVMTRGQGRPRLRAEAVLYRCVTCAEQTYDEHVPADLPPLPDPVPIQPVGQFALPTETPPADFKRRASGDD